MLPSTGLLATALQQPPLLQLSFYPFGVLLRRPTEEGGFTEYAVDPAHIAAALATRTRLDTGLLTPHTVLVQLDGLRRTVVEYRPPQRTALFVEGSDTPLRIPLPPLLLLRSVVGQAPRYGLFAVKARPTSLQAELFAPPLPNVYAHGAICWGTVNRVSTEALAGVDLHEDWQVFLGSTFTPHSLASKSRLFPDDIRKQLTALEARRARAYPKGDLVSLQLTLSTALDKLTERTGR